MVWYLDSKPQKKWFDIGWIAYFINNYHALFMSFFFINNIDYSNRNTIYYELQIRYYLFA